MGNVAQNKGRQMTDEAQEKQGSQRETGENVVIGEATLKEFSSTLSYTIPSEGVREEMKARSGEKIERNFLFGQVDSEAQANEVMAAKKWSVIDYVNGELKGNARSSCYQTTSALYKESKVTSEQIQERAIKDLIRLGVPEGTARATVEATVEQSQT